MVRVRLWRKILGETKGRQRKKIHNSSTGLEESCTGGYTASIACLVFLILFFFSFSFFSFSFLLSLSSLYPATWGIFFLVSGGSGKAGFYVVIIPLIPEIGKQAWKPMSTLMLTLQTI